MTPLATRPIAPISAATTASPSRMPSPNSSRTAFV